MCAQLFILASLLAAAPPEVAAERELLSECVPEGIVVFLDVVGGDRALDELTAKELEAVRDPAAYPGRFVAALQPACVLRVQAPAMILDAYGEAGAETFIVAGPGVVLDDEVSIPLGELVELEESVYRGYLLNAGETTLVVVDASGGSIDLPPGGVAAITCSHTCSTICEEEGRHACCWYHPETGCAFCNCIQDGKLPYPATNCSSGGEGSTACSMSSAMRPPPKQVELTDPTKR